MLSALSLALRVMISSAMEIGVKKKQRKKKQKGTATVSGALEDLGHGRNADAERQVAVAAIRVKALGAEEQRNQGDVRAVHGLLFFFVGFVMFVGCVALWVQKVGYLERDTGGVAVKVGVGDEVLDGLDDLFDEAASGEAGFKHGECSAVFLGGAGYRGEEG